MFMSGQPIPRADIPPEFLPKVGPDAPHKLKLMIAKAVVPMPPDQLGVALAALARDPDATIAAAATSSLRELPRPVLDGIVKSKLPGPLLDVYAHVLSSDQEMMANLVRNDAVLDDTVAWMARKFTGPILGVIGANQRRIIREPAIIAALIGNPATPTPVLAPVVETAIRNDVDAQRIPGFRELAEAFFSDLNQLKQEGHKEISEEDVRQAAQTDDAEGVQETIMSQILHHTSQEAEPDEEEIEKIHTETANLSEADAGEGSKKKVLWKLIRDMSVAQKVRLALLGDAMARSILIRDPKRNVAMAVMRSPRLTEKEIASFAQNKTLPEDVIRAIAVKREYTRNYSVRISLVRNPKCPPSMALSFLRQLRTTDVRKLAKAKDVPAYISRAAKQATTRK